MNLDFNKEEYDRVVALFKYGEEVYTQNDPNNGRDFEEAFVVGTVTGDSIDGERVVWPLLAIKHSCGFTGNSLIIYFDHIGMERVNKIHEDFPSHDYTFWAIDSTFIHTKKIVTLKQILKQLEHETLR